MTSTSPGDLPGLTGLAGLSLTPASTVDRVVGELRRALFAGEIAPGTPLREVALADQLRVSRSTVRESLAALVGEGLAVREPHRGVRVRTIDPDTVRDVSTARRVLEAAGVVRWAAAEEQQREAVHAAMAAFAEVAARPDPGADLTAAHLDVHRAFVGLAGSARLLAATDSLSAEVRLVLARVDRVRRNAPAQVSEHARLVDLMESGDLGAATDALRLHLDDAETSMISATDGRIES